VRNTGLAARSRCGHNRKGAPYPGGWGDGEGLGRLRSLMACQLIPHCHLEGIRVASQDPPPEHAPTRPVQSPACCVHPLNYARSFQSSVLRCEPTSGCSISGLAIMEARAHGHLPHVEQLKGTSCGIYGNFEHLQTHIAKTRCALSTREACIICCLSTPNMMWHQRVKLDIQGTMHYAVQDNTV